MNPNPLSALNVLIFPVMHSSLLWARASYASSNRLMPRHSGWRLSSVLREAVQSTRRENNLCLSDAIERRVRAQRPVQSKRVLQRAGREKAAPYGNDIERPIPLTTLHHGRSSKQR